MTPTALFKAIRAYVADATAPEIYCYRHTVALAKLAGLQIRSLTKAQANDRLREMATWDVSNFRAKKSSRQYYTWFIRS